MTTRRVSFPHMGNYHVATATLARLFGDEVITPPPITKQTLEFGAKYSPESACLPFKYTLGNFIEALDQGANVLIQAGGGCRMGFYGEVQKVILNKLGYEFEFIKLINSHNLIEVARYIKQVKPELSYWTIGRTLYLAYQQAVAVDKVETHARENVGLEAEKGTCERIVQDFLSDLRFTKKKEDVNHVCQSYMAALDNVPLKQPQYHLRVGIIGEIYLVMEPFSNFFVEKELAQYGIQVFRHLTIAGIFLEAFHPKEHAQNWLHEGAPYLSHVIGGHGSESVARAHRLAKNGFDGIIHVKPFGCMPEINAIPALHRISQDYNMPIISFSFDTLTSETGIKTRLEAFYDLLVMKKERERTRV